MLTNHRLKLTLKFKEDIDRCIRSGLRLENLYGYLALLESSTVIPRRYKRHRLKGLYAGYEECHLTPDWLLIYIQTPHGITLIRTGSHSDLFD